MELRAGQVVSIPYRGVSHEGMVTVAGTEDTATVVHSSKRRGRVVEEDGATFRAGRPVRVVGAARHPEASIAYARAELGRPWTYVDNCQAFTRRVSGLDVPSPDATRVGWFLAAAAVAVAAWGARRRGSRVR